MPEYDDTNTIILFANDISENPKRPVLTGKVNVEGKEFEVALWGRESQKGTKFWSGNVKPAEEREAVAAVQSTDDIPF